MNFVSLQIIIISLYLFAIILSKIPRIYFASKNIGNIIIYIDYFIFSIILFYFFCYIYICFFPITKNNVLLIIRQSLYFIFFIIIYFNKGLNKEKNNKRINIDINIDDDKFYNYKCLIFSIITYLFFYIDNQLLSIYNFYYYIILLTIVSMILVQQDIYETKKYLIKTIVTLIIFLIISIIIIVKKYRQISIEEKIFFNKDNVLSSIFSRIYSIFYAPIIEELIYRKLYYDSIEKFCKNKNKVFLLFWILLNSFIFYFAHIFQLLNYFLYFNFVILLIAIISSIIYLKTKNIYLSVIFHSIINIFAIYL
jgi:membrane protease YdiL (CAAX protease family)